MKKLLSLIMCLLLYCTASFSQDAYSYSNFNPLSNSLDFQYGSMPTKEIGMKAYKSDNTLNALVLNEYGKSFFISNTVSAPIQHEYHAKIKVFNNKGLKYGTVEIPLYARDKGSYDKLLFAKGTTFYTDETGKIKSIDLQAAQIETIKIDQHHSKIKFTMPKVSEGCVIEYRYAIETPYIDTLKTWRFQNYIPKLKSTYEVSIPRLFGYEVSIKGDLKLKSNTVQEVGRCFFFNGITYSCLNAVYEMEDIPAFTLKPGMTSPRSFMSAIYFQITDAFALTNFNDRNYGVRQNMATDWSEFGKFLKKKENFGDQLKKKFPAKDMLEKVIEGKITDLEKANSIYDYIRQSISWNGYYGIFTDDGVKKIFENKKGSVADINIVFISALKAVGISADPVLLSTVENGRIDKNAPSLNDMNYLVAKINIGDKVYLADATDTSVAFGKLPQRAINHEGRVIGLTTNDYWIDIPLPQ